MTPRPDVGHAGQGTRPKLERRVRADRSRRPHAGGPSHAGNGRRAAPSDEYETPNRPRAAPSNSGAERVSIGGTSIGSLRLAGDVGARASTSASRSDPAGSVVTLPTTIPATRIDQEGRRDPGAVARGPSLAGQPAGPVVSVVRPRPARAHRRPAGRPRHAAIRRSPPTSMPAIMIRVTPWRRGSLRRGTIGLDVLRLRRSNRGGSCCPAARSTTGCDGRRAPATSGSRSTLATASSWPCRRRPVAAGPGPEREIERFLAEREPWLRRHLGRLAAQREAMASRGGISDGAEFRYLGELHVLRIVPGPVAGPADRASHATERSPVTSCTSRLPQATDDRPRRARGLAPSARARRDRAEPSSATRGAWRHPVPDLPARYEVPMGECLTEGHAVLLVAPDPRAARRPGDGRRPRAGASAGLRPRAPVLGARGALDDRITSRGAAGFAPFARAARGPGAGGSEIAPAAPADRRPGSSSDAGGPGQNRTATAEGEGFTDPWAHHLPNRPTPMTPPRTDRNAGRRAGRLSCQTPPRGRMGRARQPDPQRSRRYGTFATTTFGRPEQPVPDPPPVVVVEQVLPPVARHVLREQDHEHVTRGAFRGEAEVADQRPDELPVR